MAKKARKAAASKTRKAKAPASKKRSTVKTRSKKQTSPKKPKKVKSAAKKKPARKPVARKPESLSHKIADAFKAVVDTLVDAEQLHHKLEPEISPDQE